MRGRLRETIEPIEGRVRGRICVPSSQRNSAAPPVIGNQRHSTCFLPTAPSRLSVEEGRILEESMLPLIRNAAAPLDCVEQVPLG